MSSRTAHLGTASVRDGADMAVAPFERVLAGPLHRIHIIGGPGSGKTSLAVDIGALTGLPVHHLDDVARVGGGDGPVRDSAERDRMLAEILGSSAWVTEGVHLGWTDAVFRDSDLIVWLDYVTWPGATRRIVRRFVGGAVGEMRRRPGRQRFTRFRDYGRSLRRLGAAIAESRRYYRPGEMPPGAVRHAALVENAAPPAGSSGTWLLTADAVRDYSTKLVHCRQPADVDALLRQLH
jgi:hypothetical protein